MNIGVRLALVIGFIAACVVSLVIANRPPDGKPVEQTLPSPYLGVQDIEYFPPGPDFKLQREAAAMKAHKSDLDAADASGQRPAGQVLPSPYYIQDDIQYFPPGPEFKLQREAAAMKAHQDDLETQQTIRR